MNNEDLNYLLGKIRNLETDINRLLDYKEIFEMTYDDLYEVAKDVSCTECKERCLKWLMEEYKEPVLDDVEKKYLSSVIKPFRKNVSYIEKIHSKVDTYDYICVRVNRCEIMFFPKFEENTMYKGMELGRKYTLEELGL